MHTRVVDEDDDVGVAPVIVASGVVMACAAAYLGHVYCSLYPQPEYLVVILARQICPPRRL